MVDRTLTINGRLVSLAKPWVMGILNVTPDSFYAGSRMQTEAAIDERIQTILKEGGDCVDVGGYSSRPDAAYVSPALTDNWSVGVGVGAAEPSLSRSARLDRYLSGRCGPSVCRTVWGGYHQRYCRRRFG